MLSVRLCSKEYSVLAYCVATAFVTSGFWHDIPIIPIELFYVS